VHIITDQGKEFVKQVDKTYGINLMAIQLSCFRLMKHYKELLMSRCE